MTNPGSIDRRPAALLCDRDGTLVTDVPYNRDPALVEPLPGVAAALDRARAAGVRVGIVSNQRGVARKLITEAELRAVNARVEQLLGPFAAVCCCEHDVADRCRCRKPGPGLVLRAAAMLGVSPAECVVVGDAWSDVGAARSAGAMAILLTSGGVPVASGAVMTCPDLPAAVDLLLARCEAA